MQAGPSFPWPFPSVWSAGQPRAALNQAWFEKAERRNNRGCLLVATPASVPTPPPSSHTQPLLSEAFQGHPSQPGSSSPFTQCLL